MNLKLVKLVTALAPVLAAAALWMVPFPPAGATPLANGDFAAPTDLDDWTPTPTGATVGEPTHEFAQLETGGDSQITLEQTFTLPATSSTLVFDFAFSTDAAAPTSGFPDSFAVSLYTTDGVYFLDILVVDGYGAVPDPSDGIEATTGALPVDVVRDPTVAIPGFVPFVGGFSLSGHVSLLLPAAVLGQDATLYFDLFDQADGAITIAAVDNVAVEPTAVPAPATLGLLALGLAAAGIARRRGKSAE